MRFLDPVKEAFGAATVYGTPYEKDGITVIPASSVAGGGGGGEGADAGGGGGGGGAGVYARPAGAFVIKDGDVTWIPALDVTLTTALGLLVGLAAVLSLRSIVKSLVRRR